MKYINGTVACRNLLKIINERTISDIICKIWLKKLKEGDLDLLLRHALGDHL